MSEQDASTMVGSTTTQEACSVGSQAGSDEDDAGTPHAHLPYVAIAVPSSVTTTATSYPNPGDLRAFLYGLRTDHTVVNAYAFLLLSHCATASCSPRHHLPSVLALHAQVLHLGDSASSSRP
ncbi:hypothetical protein E2562_032440 [Oryza meyeriana var. granulata]|uniref:Uncharacterized protein n=1 Tax=Oryza meyeriana var. granulata TaxID=110450 RepID=A0A6G1E676_9ORYZ|nr:hypothetical protein E2562_032440 [Oryza meyeriana var. granulata]